MSGRGRGNSFRGRGYKRYNGGRGENSQAVKAGQNFQKKDENTKRTPVIIGESETKKLIEDFGMALTGFDPEKKVANNFVLFKPYLKL